MIRSKKHIKNLLVFLPILIFFCGTSFAQPNKEQMERIKGERIAFYTEKMDLTPAEAEKFWPVYNEFSDKRDLLNDEKRKEHRYLVANITNLTDKESEEIFDKIMELHEQENNLFVEYNLKFKKILPAKKVLMLHIAEIQFRQYLLKRIRQGERGRGPGTGR